MRMPLFMSAMAGYPGRTKAGSFGDNNPGTEMVAVTYSLPLSRIFGR